MILWSAKILLEQPEMIRRLHLTFHFLAGADVAITTSHRASMEGYHTGVFASTGFRALIRRSVELAKEARNCSGRIQSPGGYILWLPLC